MKDSGYYSIAYFNRHKGKSGLRMELLKLIDRHGAMLPYLKIRYKKNSTLIDFGCGNGSFLSYAANYFSCTGVDFSKELINQAKKQIPQANFLCGSLTLLRRKFKSNSFDILTCVAMLEHVDKINDYLTEFKRIIKREGVVILGVPINDSLALKWRRTNWTILEDVSHVSLFSRNSWIYQFEKSGLLVVDIWSSGIMNSSNTKYRLPIWMRPLQFVTQGLGVLGFRLPAMFSDLDYFVCIKNPYSGD